MARYLPVVMLLISANSFCAPVGSGEVSSTTYEGPYEASFPGVGCTVHLPKFDTSKLAVAVANRGTVASQERLARHDKKFAAGHKAIISSKYHTDLLAHTAGLDSEVTALATATSATSTPPASGRSSRGCASPERTEL